MKKIVSLLLGFGLLAGAFSESAQAAAFKDVPAGHTFNKEIEYLSGKNIITGFKDGTFKPDQKVTRGGAAMLIGKMLKLDGTQRKTNFSDVPASSAASGYIQAAVDKGIIQGYSNGTFKPNDYVTRGQVAILLSRALGLSERATIGYKDVGASSSAYAAIGKVVAAKITSGYNDNTYRPNVVVTRGQLSAFMARALEPSFSKNIADGLKTVDGNKQLILVTSNGYGTSKATIRTFEKNAKGGWYQVLSTSGYIGKNGFATTKKEGDGKTPRGKYTIGTAFGTKGNPGTKLPFRGITSDDVWVDDPKSSLYNTWQSKKATSGKWSSAENMNIPAYKYGFVINYNTDRVPGAGSAIFFHIASNATLGCTATSESNVVSILRWLDPAKKPVIIQAPAGEIGNY